jgi:putative DNA primase/helicase
MLSPAHASHSQSRRDIHEEIRGRELEIVRALGIDWPPRNHATHINCPFPDHDDADPSWRWDPRKGHWYCSCDSGSAVDAVMRMHGCDFSAAAKWCWATLFGDGPAPAFSAEDLAAGKAEREEEERKKQEEQEALWRAVQTKAQKQLRGLRPADPSHPYLMRKKVGSHGLLQMYDRLAVPLKNSDGEVWNAQFISPDGKKRYYKHSRKKGLAFRIGPPRKFAVIVLAEGYATGASIFEATGLCVIVCFDKGNMLDVARSLRAKYPGAQLLLAADDDRKPDGSNPGLKAAKAAVDAVGGIVVAPDFGPAREEGEKDFNDLACRLGPDAVRAQIMAALDAFAAAPM